MSDIEREIPGAENPGGSRGYIRRLTSREGTRIIDSGGNRDATILAPVSKFNGINSRVIAPNGFIFGVGKFINISCFLSNKMEQYLIGGKGNGIRFSLVGGVSQSVSIRHKNGITNRVIVSDNDMFDGNITIHRTTADTFDVYVNDIFKGIASGVNVALENIDTIGDNGNDEAVTLGSLYNINFNDEIKIPFPHLGYGYSNTGGLVELTNVDVEAEYIKDGSTYLLDNGCVKRGDRFIPNKPDGTLIQPLEPGDTFIPGSTFLNCSPYKIDFTGGVTGTILDEENYQVFNKLNTEIWK